MTMAKDPKIISSYSFINFHIKNELVVFFFNLLK